MPSFIVLYGNYITFYYIKQYSYYISQLNKQVRMPDLLG